MIPCPILTSFVTVCLQPPLISFEVILAVILHLRVFLCQGCTKGWISLIIRIALMRLLLGHQSKSAIFQTGQTLWTARTIRGKPSNGSIQF